MKNIFLPLIVLIFVFSLQAQQTDWEKYDLKGKVKQVKATTASYSGGVNTPKNMFNGRVSLSLILKEM